MSIHPETDILPIFERHQIRFVMSYIDRISSQPGVMLGQPVIKGTRITVALLLRKLSEGASQEDLLQMYPHLQQEDMYAALAYASEVIANEEMLLPRAS